MAAITEYEIGGLGPFGFSIDPAEYSADGKVTVVISLMDREVNRFKLPGNSDSKDIYNSIRKWCATRIDWWQDDIDGGNFEFYAGGEHFVPDGGFNDDSVTSD